MQHDARARRVSSTWPTCMCWKKIEGAGTNLFVPTSLAAFKTMACGIDLWKAQHPLDCESS